MKESELDKFDATVRKVLSVSHDELKRREEQWKRDHPNKRKKREPKTSASGHASSDKD